jgi:alkanesulfonate monooxygenase SsuD/methylene tetrahydromethanopterin reductase-like flavin-dependent oxidoreductase (luciferase family)
MTTNNGVGRTLKLGLFGLNLERGGTNSAAEGMLELEWEHVVRISQHADRIGLEMLVPVARWRGFGGELDYGQASYDTFCWAAGLAAVTSRIRLMTTCHVPTIHPIVAAKQLTTIDHISRGRIGLNVVGGWFRPELEMFGKPLLEHDKRYELAEEWTRILTQLWSETEEFDFEGEFFRVSKAKSDPKPIQRPRPPIMNAGGSPRGQRFAAEFADLVFLSLSDLDDGDLEAARQKVARYKDAASTEFGRTVEAWTNVTVICAESSEEAAEIEREVLAKGDVEGVKNLLRIMGMESAVLGEAAFDSLIDRFIAGWGGPIITGNPEQVAGQLQKLASIGMDGALMMLPRWDDGLTIFGEQVLPILENRGVRLPFKPASA